MTDELKALADLLAKASPGPWHVIDGAIGVNPWIARDSGTKANGDYVRGGCILNMVAHDERGDDAAAIVASVNFLRDNLPAIIEQRAEIERLREFAKSVADLSDTGCDFIDGFLLRESARAALNPTGDPA